MRNKAQLPVLSDILIPVFADNYNLYAASNLSEQGVCLKIFDNYYASGDTRINTAAVRSGLQW